MAVCCGSWLRGRLLPLILEAQRHHDKGVALKIIPDGDRSEVAFVSAEDIQRSSLRWVILTGSFNPLHAGHEELLKQAARLAEEQGVQNVRVAYELSLGNPEKPTLCHETLLQRCEQFVARSHAFFLTFTRRPLFFEKMVLVPNSIWVMGFDTAVRLVDLKYYEDSAERMREGFQRVDEAHCRFVVAGRARDDGTYCEASNFVPPEGFGHLFHFLPSHRFRRDISSSEIRRRAQVRRESDEKDGHVAAL